MARVFGVITQEDKVIPSAAVPVPIFTRRLPSQVYPSNTPPKCIPIQVVAPCKCKGTQKWISFSALNSERRKEATKWKNCPTCQVCARLRLL